MTRTIETTIYQFKELNDEAKEKAREWWREHVFQDSYDWDCVYEMAATAADMIGIDLRTRPIKLCGGGTRMEPCIYFSGFSSQGDGACFEGTYSYKKGSVKAVKKEFPTNTELHKIAEALQDIQRRAFYKISASIRHRGHYYHSGCMDIDVGSDNRQESYDAEGIRQCMRDFADWIYSQLRKEYEYQMSNECVDENIQGNEYEFTEDGSRA